MVTPVAVATRWWDYVLAVVGDAQQKDVAHRVGIDPSHISRWARGHEPGVNFVLKFARSYDRNVLEALVAAELISEDEAELHEVRVGIKDYTLEQLATEMLERLRSND